MYADMRSVDDAVLIKGQARCGVTLPSNDSSSSSSSAVDSSSNALVKLARRIIAAESSAAGSGSDGAGAGAGSDMTWDRGGRGGGACGAAGAGGRACSGAAVRACWCAPPSGGARPSRSPGKEKKDKTPREKRGRCVSESPVLIRSKNPRPASFRATSSRFAASDHARGGETCHRQVLDDLALPAPDEEEAKIRVAQILAAMIYGDDGFCL